MPSAEPIQFLAMRLWAGMLVLSACSPAGPTGARGGESQTCGDETRVTLDCRSEVAYEGIAADTEVKIFDVATASASFEEKAMRRVNEHVERFVAAHTSACRDYNACVLDKAQYRQASEEIRERLARLPALMTALDEATTSEERLAALDAMYRDIVPDEARPEEVTFAMGIVAELPKELGGGRYVVAPGGAVPTGAQVHFEVRASAEAFLYVFQTTPRGEVRVLFPDLRIGTRNPVPGGIARRIPPGRTFRVNDRDLGVENLYVVVSRQPLSELDASLAQLTEGEVESTTKSPLLSSIVKLRSPENAEGCERRRVLELSESDRCALPWAITVEDTVASPSLALQVRTQPGDDLIATVYPFEHLSAADYKTRGGGCDRTRSTPLD